MEYLSSFCADPGAAFLAQIYIQGKPYGGVGSASEYVLGSDHTKVKGLNITDAAQLLLIKVQLIFGAESDVSRIVDGTPQRGHSLINTSAHSVLILDQSIFDAESDWSERAYSEHGPPVCSSVDSVRLCQVLEHYMSIG